MFANRLDTLMTLTKISNTQMAHKVHLNSSYVGRLRSGARPLPQKHAYLSEMCSYLADKIISGGQEEMMMRLTGLRIENLDSAEELAVLLEQWMLEKDSSGDAFVGRFVSGFTKFSAPPSSISDSSEQEPEIQHISPYLYGNEGKRKAVEQFFLMILQEKEPQTLLLFSEERMEWMYEDPVFARRWSSLFTKVLMRGNRVRIIHTVSRNMNDIVEAVMKWIPIYMTGAIEPYVYPRIRDDLFQHTLFIAPKTAAIVSRSVHQDTSQMLNEFITDKSAISALVTEYERYFALCRPLMKIFTHKDQKALRAELKAINGIPGNYYLYGALPPLFTLPRQVVQELGSDTLTDLWEKVNDQFLKAIKTERIRLVLEEPEMVLNERIPLTLSEFQIAEGEHITLSPEQYQKQIEHLKKLIRKYPNLEVRQQKKIPVSTLIGIKEQSCVIMIKADSPAVSFLLYEQNMTYAFTNYIQMEFDRSSPFV